MTSKFKQVKDALHAAWKIITLHYVYEYLLSRTIQFLVLSPILIPLSLALAGLTIYVALGIAFVVCGLVVLAVISISGPLIRIVFTVSTCYIIYQVIFTAMSYVNSKWRTLYNEFGSNKEAAISRTQLIKDWLSDAQGHLSNYIVTKCSGVYQKMHETVHGYQFDVYRPIRGIVGYTLDVLIFTYENVNNLRSKIGGISLRLLPRRSWRTKPSIGQSEKVIPTEELIQIVASEQSRDSCAPVDENDLVLPPKFQTKRFAENLTEKTIHPTVTRRRFILPSPTREDVKEIWKQTKQVQERYKAVMLQLH